MVRRLNVFHSVWTVLSHAHHKICAGVVRNENWSHSTLSYKKTRYQIWAYASSLSILRG